MSKAVRRPYLLVLLVAGLFGVNVGAALGASHRAGWLASPSAVRAGAIRAQTPNGGSVDVGIIPSDDSAGYGWNGSPASATFSMTFTEPTLTCTGAPYESSVDIGILAETSAGLGQGGQSTIYTQNFCPSYEPVYRFDLSIPGVPYNGYGYGSANPGDSITLTDTISPAGTVVSYTDNTTGASQSFEGNGGTLQTVQVGLFPIPGTVLGGFGTIPVTGVTLNDAPLGSLSDLGQTNLDMNSTIDVATSNLAPDGTDFTMSYVHESGPTVSAAALSDDPAATTLAGPADGGTALTITGSNFGTPGDNVSVTLVPQNGNPPVVADDATVVSSTEIDATTADATGSLDGAPELVTYVEVDVGGITAAAPQTFTYAPVWVSSVSPDAFTFGSPHDDMDITGWGFTGATQVQFTLPNGKGMKIKAKHLTVNDDGTSISLVEPYFPALRLGFNNGAFERSYTTDVQVSAAAGVSPINGPEDEMTFSSPPKS